MKTNEIAKNFLETIIRSYGISRKKMHALVDASFQDMLLSQTAPDLQEECVDCPKDHRGRVLMCVDRNLKIVTDFRQAVAAVAFFKEDDSELCDRKDLEGLNTYQKLVNIAFFAPIAKDKTWQEILKIKEKWQKEHYPMYHVSLISHVFCNIANLCLLDVFTHCWTRSAGDDGYPTYRQHRVCYPYGEYSYDDTVSNVYISLVMTEEDFLKINPDIVWDNYVVW